MPAMAKFEAKFEIPDHVMAKARSRARDWGEPVRIYYAPDSGAYFLVSQDSVDEVPRHAFWTSTVEPGAGARYQLTAVSQAMQKADLEEREAELEQAETIRSRTSKSLPRAAPTARKKQAPAEPTIITTQEAGGAFAGLLADAFATPDLFVYLEPYLDPETMELRKDFASSGFLAGFFSVWARAGAPATTKAFKELLSEYIGSIRSIQEGRKAKEIEAEIKAKSRDIMPSRPRGPATVSKGQWRGLPSTGGAIVEGIHHVFPAPDARLRMPPREEKRLWDLVWSSYAEHLAKGKTKRAKAIEKRREFTMKTGPGGTVTASGRMKRKR